MHIIAVGGPKGGVAKSTTSVTLAAVAAADGQRVLLVDCDPNRSSLDWIEQAGDAIPVDTADGRDLSALRKLRSVTGFDVVVVDLPGAAREGTFDAILRGADGKPVADLLVAPTGPEVVELRPTIRMVHNEVVPLGIPHLVVLTRVLTASLPRAIERQAELRAGGISVADTIIRRYTVYDEAAELGRTVLTLHGAHSYARQAEADYRALTGEVMAAVARPAVAR